MENGIKLIFVSKCFLIPVEYIDSKITIWPPDDISLIYLCWVTYVLKKLHILTKLVAIYSCIVNFLFIAERNLLKLGSLRSWRSWPVIIMLLESLLSSLNWTTIFLSVVSLLAYGWYRNVSRPAGFPPGPVALPIVGNIFGKMPFSIFSLKMFPNLIQNWFQFERKLVDLVKFCLEKGAKSGRL